MLTMPLSTENGDLLNSAAFVIVHQTNCVTRRSHGLAASVFRKWPATDIYRERGGSSPNISSICDRGVPGSLIIKKRDSNKFVANLMGQVAPGKPGAWAARYQIDPQTDTAERRLQYFKNGLDELRKFVVDRNITTVAMPWMIGCGLAGGDWAKYQQIIEDFANDLKSCKVTLYKL